MFDLPVPWVTKAARTLLQETEFLFSPEGQPEAAEAEAEAGVGAAAPADAPSAVEPVSEPSLLFAAPPKPARKSRVKPRPSEIKLQADPEPEAAREEMAEAAEPAGGDVHGGTTDDV
jgi:hypothetical protein